MIIPEFRTARGVKATPLNYQMDLAVTIPEDVCFCLNYFVKFWSFGNHVIAGAYELLRGTQN